MSKQAKQTVTAKLFALFDKLGVGLSVNLARDAAKLAGLNPTSAEIAFYHWRMDRGFYVKSARPLAH